MSESKTLNLLTEMEQFETTMVGAAEVVASYYAALINNGVEKEAAKELALNFQMIWLTSIMPPRNNKK